MWSVIENIFTLFFRVSLTYTGVGDSRTRLFTVTVVSVDRVFHPGQEPLSGVTTSLSDTVVFLSLTGTGR